MKCIETYKSREEAGHWQRLLKDKGIDARVAVDPLESMAPALSHFHDVALMVREDRISEAMAIITGSVAAGVKRKAS